MTGHPDERDFDVLIIGSGFGGSVSALRLVEKGYRVGVLEAGRRFEDADFAKTSWRLHKFLWAPRLRLFGIQRIHMLRDVMVLAGAGVGGGSLNYANTLYQPKGAFYSDPQWGHITDWKDELDPHYDQARRMLGVVDNPTFTNSDRIVKEIADDMGVGDTFSPTPVGVFFGAAAGGDGAPGETVEDPYFGGVGPSRTACTECGSCMTGCRVGAKNTLLKNYLGLAERAGARVFDRTTVVGLRHDPGADTWHVETEHTGAWTRFGRRPRTVTAQQVIVAAGTYNTQKLMHMAADDGSLSDLSPALGRLTRTNSESILGAMRNKIDPSDDFSEGVAITSSIHPAPDTHIEPCRYGKGSNAMALLQTVLTDGAPGRSRPRKLVAALARKPSSLLRLLWVKGWSQRTVILLVMQSCDNSLTTFVQRFGPFRFVNSRQGHGEPNPTWIPAGNEATERAAEKLDGLAGGTWGDVFNMPLTAHYLGGCVISDDPAHGVIDPYHRVWNYPTLHITDGAAVSANLGVNPSLTISAQAERAISLWPNKSEADPRPAQGHPYARLTPVAPHHPVVPERSQGALRLPIVAVTSRRGTVPATDPLLPAPGVDRVTGSPVSGTSVSGSGASRSTA